MNNKLANFSTQKLVGTILRFASIIVFVIAAAVLIYLSFVQNINLSPNIRNITLIAAISIVLNVVVWEMYYKDGYNKVITQDMSSEAYSIHKRYYLARKGFKYDELQTYITNFNIRFRDAFIKDCEAVTGRTEVEIVSQGYKGNSNKIIIWKLKHKRYPKSGLRTPRDVLQVLSVGTSGKMQINLKKAEHSHLVNLSTKIITSVAGMLMAASVIVEFITGDWASAIFRLLLYIAMLFTSLFTGVIVGTRAAKMKLAIAEEVSERLEEWKNEPPTEVPYKEQVTTQPVIEQREEIIEKREEIIEKTTLPTIQIL